MKKGFTLIELLAVIVVLGIILVIAVPNIMKIIDKTKIDVYIKNEEMMINAVRRYLVGNSMVLPANIGDTTEVTLDDLKNSKLMDDIKKPQGNGNCNGYVLITKVDIDKYDYTPNLNCVDDIGSSTQDALVGYWKLDGNAVDLFGNHDGIVYGAVPTTDRFGVTNKAMSFDGVNDYIDLNYGAGFNPSTTPISSTLWVKSNNTSGSMFMSTGVTTNNRFYLGITSNRWDMGIQGSSWNVGDVVATTNWTHIAIVLNGSVAKIYANGVVSRTLNYTSYTFYRNVYLSNHDNSYWFNGSIDDVKIYNRALSAEEVNYIYNIEKYTSR